jgi:hypothetical protein
MITNKPLQNITATPDFAHASLRQANFDGGHKGFCGNKKATEIIPWLE